MSRFLGMFFVFGLMLFVSALGCGQIPAKLDDAPAASAKPLLLVRTPDGGIQPQAVAYKGIHLIYFRGDPKGGDVYYVKGRLQGEKVTFTRPLRVNSRRGSVLALGNIRGAHLAVSRSGRVHVAWVGSATAEPKAPGGQTPMLYSRLNDEGTAFEPERNLIHEAVGIDGGSLAADGQNVFVFWHAPEPGQQGEGHRRVWLIESSDDGKTFSAKERVVSPADTGVCGCCGMHASSYAGGTALLYRSAAGGIHRDTYLLQGNAHRNSFVAVKLDAWETVMCPMSTFGLYPTGKGWLAGWETKGQVYFGLIASSGELICRSAAPGKGGQRKHPIVCSNGREMLLAWTEGLQWGKGGSVAWQVYRTTDNGKVMQPDRSGRADGVPAWSLIAAVPQGDQFVIFY